MLIGIVGNLGAGKTLLLTAMIESLKNKRMIVSNYTTSFSDVVMDAEEMILRIDEFEHPVFTDRVFAIDELGSILKALEFYSDESELLTDIARKSRKKNTDIYYTTQHLMMVDRNMRRITDLIIHVRYNDLTKEVLGEPYMFDGLNVVYSEPFKIKASKYFSMYDTYEVIEPNRESVLNYFLDKIKSDKQLMKDLGKTQNKKEQIKIIKWTLKISLPLSEMLFIRLLDE